MSQVDPSLYEHQPRPSAMKVLAVVAVVLFALIVAGILVARYVLAPRVAEQGRIVQSTNNIRNLCQLLADRGMSGRWPPYGGKAFVLSLAADRVVNVEYAPNTEVFFSPADPYRRAENVSPDRWRELTRQALRSGMDLDDLTSYAGRRNDDREYRLTPQVLKDVAPIMADLHFEDVAIVGFSDGRARAMDRAELGLGPDDPIVAGELSTSPILRALSDE